MKKRRVISGVAIAGALVCGGLATQSGAQTPDPAPDPTAAAITPRTVNLECRGDDAVRQGSVTLQGVPDPVVDTSQEALDLLGTQQDPPAAAPFYLQFPLVVTGDAPGIPPNFLAPGESAKANFQYQLDISELLTGAKDNGVPSIAITNQSFQVSAEGDGTVSPNPSMGTLADQTLDLTGNLPGIAPITATFDVTAGPNQQPINYKFDYLKFGAQFTAPPGGQVPLPATVTFGVTCTPVPADNPASFIYATTNGEPPAPPPPPPPPPTAPPTTAAPTTTAAPAAEPAQPTSGTPRFAG